MRFVRNLLARLAAWLFVARAWLLGRGPLADATDDEVIASILACPPHYYTPIGGNAGGILVNGVAVAGVMQWSAQPKPRNADITSSSTNGYQDSQTVVKGWAGTVKIIMDADLAPAAAGITQGASVTLLLVIGASGRQWGGLARLDGPSPSVDNQNGVVTYDLAWESKGVWPSL